MSSARASRLTRPPQAMLKLYLYDYLQGIRSSCNLEMMWLIKGLRPNYKSIADVRKNNSTALKSANRDVLLLCKELLSIFQFYSVNFEYFHSLLHLTVLPSLLKISQS